MSTCPALFISVLWFVYIGGMIEHHGSDVVIILICFVGVYVLSFFLIYVYSRSTLFPFTWCLCRYIVTRWVPHMKQELPTLSQRTRGS